MGNSWKIQMDFLVNEKIHYIILTLNIKHKPKGWRAERAGGGAPLVQYIWTILIIKMHFLNNPCLIETLDSIHGKNSV